MPVDIRVSVDTALDNLVRWILCSPYQLRCAADSILCRRPLTPSFFDYLVVAKSATPTAHRKMQAFNGGRVGSQASSKK